jgi:hypothetical protein
MTQDEIIEMARQAWKDSGEGWVDTNWFNGRAKAFETFANLVAAKEQKKWQDQTAVEIHEAILEEREACAKIAEQSFGFIGSTIALAIRAKGEQA